MSDAINHTHDPQLRSWVPSAAAPHTDFPIQNLPFGVFKRRGSTDQARVGVAIGSDILDLAACLDRALFDGMAATAAQACRGSTLNGLMALGQPYWSALRAQLSALLRHDSPAYADDPTLGQSLLVPMAEADLLLPAAIGDYTDFYASIYHATNVGSMFRPDNPLLPNYKHLPIGYHGRASSIVISGTPVRRPCGQTKPPDMDQPSFGPSQMLDYELELGCFVGAGNMIGQPIAIGDAAAHLFGVCMVNDWSARDLQTWEYQPLGPFLAKSFATTISSWIVTLDALAPFRSPAMQRAADDPPVLAYLSDVEDAANGGLDVQLEVYIATAQMQQRGVSPVQVSRSQFTDMYWTVAQMLTHHASNGCNLRPGDLLASGTVSGAAPDARGCLLERTWRGTQPITFPGGETRTFLQDGDEVILRGFCQRSGFARIGLGECRGIVLPVVSDLSTSRVTMP